MNDFLVAEAGIRELQARYTNAVWRKDFAAFADCFAEDGEWRIAGMVLRGGGECRTFLEGIFGDLDRVRMTMQPPLLQVNGDTAIGRTEVIEHNISKDRKRNLAIGEYYDRFVRIGDQWKFAWHYYQLYYLGPPDMSGAFYEIRDYGPPFAMPPADEPPQKL